MAIIIDAYNVLHCTHILPERFAMMGVGQMCDLLSVSRWRYQRKVVVCDGVARLLDNDGHDDVELIYAGGGKDADTVIERLIEVDSGPRDLIVVSNDRRIQRAARRRRAKVMRSEDFLFQLISSVSKEDVTTGKPTEEEAYHVDYWLDKFGVDDDEADEIDVVIGGGASENDVDVTDDDEGGDTSGDDEGDAGEGDTRDKRSSGPLTDNSTDYWLRKFGYDDGDEGEGVV